MFANEINDFYFYFKLMADLNKNLEFLIYRGKFDFNY